LQTIPKHDQDTDRLDRLEAKLDLIIRSLGLDGSHTHLELERKASKIFDLMKKRELTRQSKRFKKENGRAE
jgi:hypothetical protein